jgi:hypothetical protein
MILRDQSRSPRGQGAPAAPSTRPWHLLRAWLLARKIRRQHQELAKYIRRSAYEIAAWKQDIGFLEEQWRYHLLEAGVSRAGTATNAQSAVLTSDNSQDDGEAPGVLRHSVSAPDQAEKKGNNGLLERRSAIEWLGQSSAGSESEGVDDSRTG